MPVPGRADWAADPTGGTSAASSDDLRQLNDAYIQSDQNSDADHFEEFLAEDFTSTLPDMVFRSRRQFLTSLPSHAHSPS
jgi:hypothetical protein